MAERIDELPRSGTGRSRPEKYPWQEWTDGSVWRVIRGEDFEIPPKNFRVMLHAVARRGSMRAKTRVSGDEITFQFSPREAA